jgi:hypothetical protein
MVKYIEHNCTGGAIAVLDQQEPKGYWGEMIPPQYLSETQPSPLTKSLRARFVFGHLIRMY